MVAMPRRSTRRTTRFSATATALIAILMTSPSLSAVAENVACATVDVAQYKSPCGSMAVSKTIVAAGEKLTVVVEVPSAPSTNCGGGPLTLSASFALPTVVVDGKTVTGEQTTLANGGDGSDDRSPLAGETATRPTPKVEPGRRVTLTYGRHVVEFTIDPKAPDSCLRLTRKENLTFAEGPWVVLSGGPERAGAVRWYTMAPFSVRAAVAPTASRTLTVNSARDARDADLTDGVCDVDPQTAGSQCTLRAAIEEANRTTVEDRIVFSIPGEGIPTIAPEAALPTVTQPVVIDATTQAAGLVELDGTATWGPGPKPRAESGLVIAAGKSTVRGLVINRFPQFGLVLRERGGNTIEGNFIGTDKTGARALGNGTVYFVESGAFGGEETRDAATATNLGETEALHITGGGIAIYQSGGNRIGGTRPAARNVIAGNVPVEEREKRDGDLRAYGLLVYGAQATGNTIEGNWFGLQRDGATMMEPAEGMAIALHGAPRNKIGGVAEGAGNRIAARYGVVLRGPDAAGNVIEGNEIDFDLSRRARAGEAGVWIAGAKETVVGGDDRPARNLVSGFHAGVRVTNGLGNRVLGNFIGANVDGLTPRRSAGNGVVVNSSRTTAVERNVVAFNDGDGVVVEHSSATRISKNSIFSNDKLGINLLRPATAVGAASLPAETTAETTSGESAALPWPLTVRAAHVAGGVTTVRGELRGRPSSTFIVEYFANRACDPSGFGEGQLFLESKTVTVQAGSEVVPVQHALPAVQAGVFITATVTAADGATSEFSRCVQVMGDTDTDGDGVSDDVEGGAANNGDGNNDGVADARQAHVVSFPALSGAFVTIAAPAGTTLVGLGETFLDAALTRRSYHAGLNGPRPAPPGTSFPLGLFHFAVRGLAPGTAAAATPSMVTMYWPPDPRLKTYWQFGPTRESREAHWYPFVYDGALGAQLREGGAVLHVADGQFGDHDLEVNGAVVLRGGPANADAAVSPTSGPATGGTAVTIKARGFSRGVAVTFGGTKATSVKVVDERVLVAVTPAHAAGKVDIVISSPGGTGLTLPAAFTFTAPPATVTSDDDGDQLADLWEQKFSLDARDSSDASADPDGDGKTNLEEQRAGTHPRGFHTRYLAEGASGSFFETSFALVNPTEQAATVLMRFLKSDGTTGSHHLSLAPMSRATVRAADLATIAAAEFSTIVESDEPVVIDRTMKWNATGYGSHAETSLSTPSSTWYLAEGATHSGFSLFYLVQNPHETAAEVDVTYLRPQPAPPVVRHYTVPAGSRFTIFINQIEGLESTDVSAVVRSTNGVSTIVERAMYLNTGTQTWGAGHASAAVRAPSTRWFLAEGATGDFFDFFVLVANPSDSDAPVRATYLLPGGQTLVRDYVVSANSRFNIWVDKEAAELADTAVSVALESLDAVPIIVERSMWWPGPTSQTWQEAHNSPGATAPAAVWALADGELGGATSTETYVLVANTSTVPASVQVTLLFEDATTAVKTFTMPASSRFNVNVAAEFPEAANRRFGAVVESLGDAPALLVVERAMYSNAAGSVWAAGTNALGTVVR